MSRITASQHADMSEAFALSDPWDVDTTPDDERDVYVTYRDDTPILSFVRDATNALYRKGAPPSPPRCSAPVYLRYQLNELPNATKVNSTVVLTVDGEEVPLKYLPEWNQAVSGALDLAAGRHEVITHVEVAITDDETREYDFAGYLEVTE